MNFHLLTSYSRSSAAALLMALPWTALTAEPERSAPAPSIDALTSEILATNPELTFYREEVSAAQAVLRGAGAPNNPELSVQAGHKRTRDPAGMIAGEGTAWSVSVSQTFEWPGRLALRKAIANRDVALAELGLARFEAALATRARILGFGLFAAQQQAKATAEVADRFRTLKETFLARDPAGMTPLLETRVVEAQELTLQRRATEAALAAQSALVELNQLRGLPVDTPAQANVGTLVFHPAPSLEELLVAARENHFEFRARKLELEQQGFLVQLARNERRPSFTISPYVTRESADTRETTIGLGLSVPLPLSSRSRSGIDAAAARRRQAEAALLMAQRDLERDVIHAAQTFSAKREETARWARDSVEKFQEAATVSDRHYRMNAVPLTTYVSLQTAYLDAVDTLLATQREALEAGLQLQLLTGLNFNAVEMLHD